MMEAAFSRKEAFVATTTSQQDTALFVAAFFDELTRWGVRDVVVSPGSRSTALAMAAFELSCRRPDALRVFVDIDERGASFLGLGMAKASLSCAFLTSVVSLRDGTKVRSPFGTPFLSANFIRKYTYEISSPVPS